MDTKEIAINRAINLLQAIDAVFEIHYGGKVYGGLPKEEVKLAKKKSKPKMLPEHRGKVTQHIRTKYQDMKVGEAITLRLSDPEIAHVDIENLQSTAASTGGIMWGVRNYITHRIEGNKALEVLRLA
jgi:hypothetical protein